jgi:CheY-like chemotaxis protein
MGTMIAGRVLLLEDDDPIRELMVEYLRDEGFHVTEARTGDQAMTLLVEPDRYDILMTDVRMPGRLDGVDVAEFVRRQYPDMPVLITSGYAAQLVGRIRALGPPTVFINKPYDVNEVVEILRRMTGQSRALH